MLIIKNAEGGGTNLINSGKNNADGTTNGNKIADNTNHDVDLFALLNNDNFPIGTIMIFNGSVTPEMNKDGWFICDGKNGTPPLLEKQGRFIRCISNPNDSNAGKTGGHMEYQVPDHTHTITTDSSGGHSHDTKETEFESEKAGGHTHYQKHATHFGNREVCSICGPVSGGSKKVVPEPGYSITKTTKNGEHQHDVNFKKVTTTKSESHDHHDMTLSAGTPPAPGTPALSNLPQHTNLIHIMKVK